MRSTASRKPPYNAGEAIAALAAADPQLSELMERAGPFRMRITASLSLFEALAESIIYQQLHSKAAAAIHKRMIEGFAEVAGTGTHPSPEHLLDCPTDQLRSAGLSASKTLALRDLAAKTLDGTLPSLSKVRRMSDESVIDNLTQVRGIGRWTVEMLLMFRLGRPDVLPVDDYGVRKGFALTFRGLKAGKKVMPADLPKPVDMHKRAERWHPWCSVASWYLWRACDLATLSPHLQK